MTEIKKITSLYNLYVKDMFTYGSYLGFEREVVKDAIHDVFIKVTEEKKRLSSISNIKFYLFKSLKNRLLDITNRTSRFSFIGDENKELHELPFTIDVYVEDLISEKEKQEQIKVDIEYMLSTLTHRQREAIYLRYIHEYDYNEIAQLLKISVHGSRKLVSKAMLTLREKFGVVLL